MTRAIAILGAGGHGRVIADCAEAIGWDRIDFFDDVLAGSTSGVWRVVGGEGDLRGRVAEYDAVVVGIGDNRVRLRLHRQLVAQGAPLASLIHPKAAVSPHARIGAGTVVFAGAAVNIGAETGDACIINTGAGVDHDCRLADGVHISPGAHLGGGVSVGECSWVGIGASVRHGVAIGVDVRVGVGAAVASAVPDHLVVVGVPARPLERSSNA